MELEKTIVINGEEYRVDKDNHLHNIREEKKIEETVKKYRDMYGRFDFVSIMTVALIIQIVAFLISIL